MGRGRKSYAELASLAVIPGTRPPPPAQLTPEQAIHWRTITNRLPQSWFGEETQFLLRELVRHVDYCDALARDIEALRSSPDATTEELHQALKAHALQSERLANLSTKLRLTKQSRLDR